MVNKWLISGVVSWQKKRSKNKSVIDGLLLISKQSGGCAAVRPKQFEFRNPKL